MRWLWLATASVGTAYFESTACKFDSRSFSGIRVWKQWHVEFPHGVSNASLVISHCELGIERSQIEIDPDSNLFNTTWCGYDCLRLVRRPQYVGDRLRYLPGTLMGAAYLETDNGKWMVWMPLVAEPFSMITEIAGPATHIVFRESILRTPDAVDKYWPRHSAWTNAFPSDPYEIDPSDIIAP